MAKPIRVGVPQNVVAPKYIGDTGKIYKSTYIDLGQIQTIGAEELIPSGRGCSINVLTNKMQTGSSTSEELTMISGISVLNKYEELEESGEHPVGLLRVGYVGVEMEHPKHSSNAKVYMDKVTGKFSGLKEVGMVEVLNAQIIPAWSNSIFTVLYINRRIIYKIEE